MQHAVTQPRCRLGLSGPVGTVLLLSLARICVAADFSADIVSPNAATAKLYAAGYEVRIETPEAAMGFFLIDGKAGRAVFVRPGQQLFTDARLSTRLTQLFIPVDPDNPCTQWQAAARNAGAAGADGEWHCEKIETGATTRWRVTPPDEGPRECWIDSSLRFPVRVRMRDGAILSLENIRLGAQSADLFAIPATYRKLDPQALIDRIKHSDVWVGN